MFNTHQILLVAFVLYVCYKMISTQSRNIDRFYKSLFIGEFVNPVSQYGLPLGNLPRDDEAVFTQAYLTSFNNGVVRAYFDNDQELLDFPSGNNKKKTILEGQTIEDTEIPTVTRGARYDAACAKEGKKL